MLKQVTRQLQIRAIAKYAESLKVWDPGLGLANIQIWPRFGPLNKKEASFPIPKLFSLDH